MKARAVQLEWEPGFFGVGLGRASITGEGVPYFAGVPIGTVSSATPEAGQVAPLAPPGAMRAFPEPSAADVTLAAVSIARSMHYAPLNNAWTIYDLRGVPLYAHIVA